MCIVVEQHVKILCSCVSHVTYFRNLTKEHIKKSIVFGTIELEE